MTTVRQRMLRAEDFPPQARQTLDPLLRFCNDLATDCASILNGGLHLSSNANAFASTVTIQLQDDWIAPTFRNGFTNYGSGWETAAYRKAGREVIVRGLVKGGSVGSSILSVPSGYAPANGVHLPAIADNQAATLQIVPDGSLNLAAAASYSDHLSVRARWEASDPSPVPNPAFPIAIKNRLKGGSRPSGVLVLGAVDITTPSAPVPVAVGGCPAWQAAGNNLSIGDVAGLMPLRKYQLSFLVLG